LALLQQALQLSSKVVEINQETLLRFQHFKIFLGDEQGVEEAGIIVVTQQDVQTLKREAKELRVKITRWSTRRTLKALFYFMANWTDAGVHLDADSEIPLTLLLMLRLEVYPLHLRVENLDVVQL